ncbi:MAG: prepilin-type N-terminal cleavage/methylation domain-containing protein [Methylococcaceae bacterium]|nr:prepilin-type N-terminal cleavage/methylation domain-containing protein [Methylococcaceae bacterium]
MSLRKINAGFTLIEVLIAMTLLGIMVVLLFSSMKTCAESWQKGEDKIAEVNDAAVVYQFFQHHLTTALPLWDDFSEKDSRVFAFQGKHDEIQFVSSFPASAKKTGLQLFSLKLMKDDEGQSIQVSITPFFPSAEGEEWRKEEVTLLNHVSSFSLSYFGSDDIQGEGYWQDVWQQESQPRLVKIKIERDDGSYWPDMLFDMKFTGQSSDSSNTGQSDEEQAQAEAAGLENNSFPGDQ